MEQWAFSLDTVNNSNPSSFYHNTAMLCLYQTVNFYLHKATVTVLDNEWSVTVCASSNILGSWSLKQRATTTVHSLPGACHTAFLLAVNNHTYHITHSCILIQSHMIIDDLKYFLRWRYTTSLQFGPNWHICKQFTSLSQHYRSTITSSLHARHYDKLTFLLTHTLHTRKNKSLNKNNDIL